MIRPLNVSLRIHCSFVLYSIPYYLKKYLIGCNSVFTYSPDSEYLSSPHLELHKIKFPYKSYIYEKMFS